MCNAHPQVNLLDPVDVHCDGQRECSAWLAELRAIAA
jgi:hypothetical protein